MDHNKVRFPHSTKEVKAGTVPKVAFEIYYLEHYLKVKKNTVFVNICHNML